MQERRSRPFFAKLEQQGLSITYRDVRLKTGQTSGSPADRSLITRFSRRVPLNIPFVSAAMDRITEAPMAIALAQAGGLGILHRGLSAEAQAGAVREVKETAAHIDNAAIPGATAVNVDVRGKLRAGAAIAPFTGDLERVARLVDAGVDVLVIDTAHGDTYEVQELIATLKKRYPEVDVVAGNISEAESARRLAEAGADGIKVGQGPGSICTTRIVAGIGCPQVTALYECSEALSGMDVPLCADGGIEHDGDVPIALAAGADSVMLGSRLAGTDEAPGKTVLVGKKPMKEYRGMGSLAALSESSASRARYMQSQHSILLAEGVEALVPLRGSASDVLARMAAATRKGMWYAGIATIGELHVHADFRYYSAGAQAESDPHGVAVIPDSIT